MKAFVLADTHVSSTVLETQPRSKFTFTQMMTAFTVSLVSMIIGYTAAYTSPAQCSLEREFLITTNQMSWISSLMPLGALFGGIFGGPMIERIGRKKTIILTVFLFLTGWATNYFAKDHTYLYASRIICGIAVGIASLSLPVYLAETLQPEVRGTLGLLPATFGNVGILTCFFFGVFYQWKSLALIGGIITLPALLMLWWIPETPRYHISRDRQDRARLVLKWLRGPQIDITKELADLQETHLRYRDRSQTRPLSSRKMTKLLLIVLGLMFFQQVSGINAVIFYTTRIFKDCESNLDESICTAIVGLVNFLSTFVASLLIDKWGRKVLLYISSVSVILSLGTLGTYFYLKTENLYDLQPYGWVPLASFIVYIIGFSLGFGPIPWLMMGEILPAKIRGRAASVITAFSWACSFTITRTFLPVAKAVGTHYTFWVFGISMVVAVLFIAFFVPETKGLSLEDLERKLAGARVRAVGSRANLRPMPSVF